MYWSNKDQELFIEMMEKGESPKNIALKFGKSITATRSKITRIKRAKEQMEELGISEKILIETVYECGGYAPEIKNRLSITSHMLISFVHCYPKIKIKISNIKNENQVFDNQGKNKIVKRKKIIKIDENVLPTFRNYLQQAEEILQGRLTKHPKLGRLLDGNMVNIKQILEAAGLNDPAFYV